MFLNNSILVKLQNNKKNVFEIYNYQFILSVQTLNNKVLGGI